MSGLNQTLLNQVRQFRERHAVPETAKSRVAQPPIPYFGDEILEMAVTALLKGENILLTGGKATGKNILAEKDVYKRQDRAYLCNRYNERVHGGDNDFTMFGSITMNRQVGGINPVAVEVALKLGAKVVWLPTQWAGNHPVSYTHLVFWKTTRKLWFALL